MTQDGDFQPAADDGRRRITQRWWSRSISFRRFRHRQAGLQLGEPGLELVGRHVRSPWSPGLSHGVP